MQDAREAVETRTMRKVTWRLVPLVTLLYFVSYIDRTNLAFAGLTMNKDLGFSPKVFGLGGSFFFVGYLLLQIPGTLAIDRLGARRLLMLMSLLWGVFAVGMAFVWNEASFYGMRALLGAAESAFFPGALYYLSLWFPAAYRARILMLFLVANPFSSVVGFPLAAFLMKLDGTLGLAGWQWVFVGEGLPAVVLAVVVLKYLTNVPAEADWLTREERDWLIGAMVADAAGRAHGRGKRIGAAIFSLPALTLALGYFGIIMGIYGLSLWIPLFVRQFGFSVMQIGFVAAIPYLVASAALVIWGLRSTGEGAKAVSAAAAALTAAVGFGASTLVDTATLTMLALSVAAIGLYIALTAFWTIPTAYYSGPAGAAVIGFVSSMGHLGGFAGPYVMGVFRELYDSFAFGLCGLALALLMSAAVAWSFRRMTRDRPVEAASLSARRA
ncbi:MFS transporter [Methylobacterium sp. J-030]|uniref:MFS transporter n=1 Tax=Methylobacterium sp. J-030 TaxID=2836627 RepID=UPI001FBBB88F|nr:MFS transporter [Methylobacterium sp. J-030]MCJ2072441.1 MFS transporter [Methylobacterium sp. J-030]